jgi:hypothetical protein
MVVMINANIREIQYATEEQKAIVIARATRELVPDPIPNATIKNVELPDIQSGIKRELLIKLYTNRLQCPIGAIAINNDEDRYDAEIVGQWMPGKWMPIHQMQFAVFAIQAKTDVFLYWVRLS